VGVPAILEQGIPIDSLGITRGFATFESNVLFVLRFMVDCSIVGGNWIELPAGTYSRTVADSPSRLSHCQIEVHCHFSTILSHPPEGDVPTLKEIRFIAMACCMEEDGRGWTPIS
jgi:DNA polymerase delta subunit 1